MGFVSGTISRLSETCLTSSGFSVLEEAEKRWKYPNAFRRSFLIAVERRQFDIARIQMRLAKQK